MAGHVQWVVCPQQHFLVVIVFLSSLVVRRTAVYWAPAAERFGHPFQEHARTMIAQHSTGSLVFTLVCLCAAAGCAPCGPSSPILEALKSVALGVGTILDLFMWPPGTRVLV